MNRSQIEKNLATLVGNFDKDEFVYDLLRAYGISKTSITRLKKGDFNLSKVEGEVLYKSKMLFKEVESGTLLHTIDELTKDPESLRHNPRFVIVTDYKTLLAKDLRTGLALDTPINEIDKHYGFFLPWAGQEKYSQTNENFADRKASYEMAKLYDILVTENPNIYDDGGHNLNIFLSRLLFCFFAEDTDIFPIEGMFTDTLAQHTQKDGSDTNTFLDRLFKILNTKNMGGEASHFEKFPYVNGGLFRDTIISPRFTREARKIIIACGDLDWSEINPDIFGSMIQAVVNPAYRSGLGMHYTSVPNIMKVIEPLFLNELYDEFEKQKDNEKKLKTLIARLGKLKIFDPACGSGNFLIIAYKVLRKLEIKIWQQIDFNRKESKLPYQTETVYTNIQLFQFYGIELDDFAHEMAILSLWLAEHQMNKVFVDELFEFGKAKPILPLKKAGHITQGNATRLAWKDTCPKNKSEEIYILGNPPYLGARMQDSNQKKDIEFVYSRYGKSTKIDYIFPWFLKASEYIKNLIQSKYSFVSTNSICQGELVALLWPYILNMDLEIAFAHTSFKWENNAKGNAGVMVVIIGIRNIQNAPKYLYNSNINKKAKNISPYLIEGNDSFVTKQSQPISHLPKMEYGNMAIDGGGLIMSINEKNKLLNEHPDSLILIRRVIGAQEFLKGLKRYCLWITDDNLEYANSISFVKKRVSEVKEFRLSSSDKGTHKIADRSHQFREMKESISSIIIPTVSSSRRNYLPIDFLNDNENIIAPNQAIYNARPWIFGVISSSMHLIWVKAVGGRMKSDYRYSSTLCYNTFPFPEISQKQKEQINLHVFAVLEEREKHPEKTMAQLYDPDKMPKGLKEAHHQLDLAIERCYRLKPFEGDTERLEYLFKEYERMVNKNTLLEKPKKKRKAKNSGS